MYELLEINCKINILKSLYSHITHSVDNFDDQMHYRVMNAFQKAHLVCEWHRKHRRYRPRDRRASKGYGIQEVRHCV